MVLRILSCAMDISCRRNLTSLLWARLESQVWEAVRVRDERGIADASQAHFGAERVTASTRTLKVSFFFISVNPSRRAFSDVTRLAERTVEWVSDLRNFGLPHACARE